MNRSSPPVRVELEVVPRPPDLFEAFAAADPRDAPILLDGAPGVDEGRYTVFVSEPSRAHRLVRDPATGALDAEALARWFQALRAGVDRVEVAGDVPAEVIAELPFVGGFVGALDYEAGGAFVRRPESAVRGRCDELGWFGFYPRGYCRDEERGVTYAFRVVGEETGHTPDEPLTTNAAREPVPWGGRGDAYRAGVERVLERIAAGEIYQANLCTPFVVQRIPREGVLAVARALRGIGRAPYGAFLQRPGRLVVSNSPERLFRLRGDRIETQPIKGTRARDPDDPARDRRLAQELLQSAKDRAELVMIVDLYRNDLGRVARPGSVRVDGGIQVRSFSRVHHLVADVSARLAPGRDAWDVLAAAFPAGSITGAPKRRAMQVIDTLETEPRGIYTGSIGMVDVRGHAAFNVAIRTAEWTADTLHLAMGAGIVADSDPARELAELHAKAAAWRMALDRADLRAPALRGA